MPIVAVLPVAVDVRPRESLLCCLNHFLLPVASGKCLQFGTGHCRRSDPYCFKKKRESPRREVVRSSAGAGVVYPKIVLIVAVSPVAIDVQPGESLLCCLNHFFLLVASSKCLQFGTRVCRRSDPYYSPRREVVRSSAGAGVAYPSFFWGYLRSIPQGMIFDVQPFVKSLFCPIRQSPNVFFDFEASIP